jgi:hypothetical protein
MSKKYAEIYLITSPSGKRYVGKANCIDSKGHTEQLVGGRDIYEMRKPQMVVDAVY